MMGSSVQVGEGEHKRKALHFAGLFLLVISELGVFQLMPRVELTHFNVYLYAHPYLSVFSL